MFDLEYPLVVLLEVTIGDLLDGLTLLPFYPNDCVMREMSVSDECS